ncbi:MAG: M43 family zinc metalloprotease [Crocinitomicaceae bacterium]
MKQVAYIVFMLFSFTTISQENWCGTDAILESAYESDPFLKHTIAEHMSRMHEGGVASDRTDSLIIPVVFHILHDGENGNISHAQILDAVRMMNEDFNRSHADTVDTRNTADAPFLPVAANINICFQLAKIDPNGNCTNGVQRRDSPAGSYNGSDQTSKSFNGGGLTAWNRSQYFNIWVVNSIATSSTTGITLGYAQFPYFGNANTYGVIIRHDRVGSIGTAVSADRTLTHEVGHCFGLFHTFQDGCGTNTSDCTNQGDYCCDTPPVDQAHWSCGTTQNYCSQVPPADYYGFDAFDQFENFMSYSPCQNMFSNDQKNVILYNFDTYTWLGNLSTASNLLATGVSLPATLCKAEFGSNKRVICAGESVNFSDFSYSGVSGRTWNFTGGSPSSSNDSTVSVNYSSAGTYPVSIDVTDGATNMTETKTNYVIVLPNTGSDLPVIEGFESLATFPDNTDFFSSSNGTISDWEISTTSSSSGSKSVLYNNFSIGNPGGTAILESGTIDLSNLAPGEDLEFSFDYAYKKVESSNNEKLQLFVSKDCGETWVLRKTLQGNLLGSETTTLSYNANLDDYKTVNITNISSTYHVSNFRYRFEFTSDGGNNIFIDNINIFGENSLAINDSDDKANFKLYPNPTQNLLQVEIDNTTIESYQISNASGQEVEYITQPTMNSDRILLIDTERLSNGIYYISIVSQNAITTQKFIKQ